MEALLKFTNNLGGYNSTLYSRYSSQVCGCKRESKIYSKRDVASYHAQMIAGIRGLLAIVGLDELSKLSKKTLLFKDHTGKTYMNVDRYFEESLVE